MKYKSVILVLVLAAVCGCGNRPAKDEEKQQVTTTPVEAVVTKKETTAPAEAEVTKKEAETSLEERILTDQSFQVSLEPWGEVQFVSVAPSVDAGLEDVTFQLRKNGEVVYNFPYYENKKESTRGLFESVGAAAAKDLDGDVVEEIIVIPYYYTGAGPQGAIPRPVPRVYRQRGDEYVIDYALSDDLAEGIPEDQMSMESILAYIERKAPYVQAERTEEFMDTVEGRQYQAAAYRFAKAYLEGDESYIREHALNSEDIFTYGDKLDVSQVECMIYRNELCEEDNTLIHGEYIIGPGKDQGFIYLVFSMRYVDGMWMVEEYELDA